MLNNLQKMHLKRAISKRAIQKPAEATGDLIGSNIVDAIAKSSKDKITRSAPRALAQNTLEIVSSKTEDI